VAQVVIDLFEVALLCIVDETWSTLVRKNTSEPTAVVQLTGLKVDAQYQFRVIAINSKGISQPSPVSEYFTVPGECMENNTEHFMVPDESRKNNSKYFMVPGESWQNSTKHFTVPSESWQNNTQYFTVLDESWEHNSNYYMVPSKSAQNSMQILYLEPCAIVMFDLAIDSFVLNL